MADIHKILASCTDILPGYQPRRSMRQVLIELAEGLGEEEFGDVYGGGPGLAAFEQEIADLFGKEAGVFMPSGTMAQQIALRIWCEKRRNLTVAMHPTAHLEFAEHAGYQFLHGLRRLQFGAPEFLRERMLVSGDFEKLGQEPGVALLELPYRPLGGPLPSWDDLLAIREWTRDHGVPLHLDGARIWQCRPHYQKTYSEIAALFDSMYVSFYKDIGGLCGAMLLGSKAFVAEARVWQIRHGGRLRTQGPFWASAKLGVKRVLPQIDDWVAKTRSLATTLSACPGIRVSPNPPAATMFLLYVDGDAERLNVRHWELVEETGTCLFLGLQPSAVPGIAVTEIHCGENSMGFDEGKIASFVERLLG